MIIFTIPLAVGSLYVTAWIVNYVVERYLRGLKI